MLSYFRPGRRLSTRRSLARLAVHPFLEGLESRQLLAGGPLTVVITELGTGQSVTIMDNGTGDSNSTTGIINYSTPSTSPFTDFSITGFSATSNRTRVHNKASPSLIQSGTVVRTTTTGVNETLEIQVEDTGYMYPSTETQLGSSASVTYTNSVVGDTSQFQSFYNTTPSPIVALTYSGGNPKSLSGTAANTTISGTAPFNLSNTYTITLAPSGGSAHNEASFQSTGNTGVIGTNASSVSTTIDNASTNQPISGNQPAGTSVYDTATVSTTPFTFPKPTGTVTYEFFDNGTGSGSPASTYTVTPVEWLGAELVDAGAAGGRLVQLHRRLQR